MNIAWNGRDQGTWGAQIARKTLLEFGLYSIGTREPLKVLE
jgi:hypothetical protein